MSNPKTTWEDLAALGWRIQDVFEKANKKRGNTMKDKDDLSLNSGIAAEHKWWSYNTTVGSPTPDSSTTAKTRRVEVAWSYDNTESSDAFAQEQTEKWTNEASAQLTLPARGVAKIKLNGSVTVPDVASSGLDISISVEAASVQPETKEASHNLSKSWTIDVGAHEKLTLLRIITSTSEDTIYNQKFGLTNKSLVGTTGAKYNDRSLWGLNLNSLLGFPTGQLTLQGSSSITSYSFKLVRETEDGQTEEPLSIEGADVDADVNVGHAVVKQWAAQEKWATQEKRAAQEKRVGIAPIRVMIPGPN